MRTNDCDSNQFLLAVYDVFKANEANEADGGMKAKAERWTSNAEFRRQVMERVRDAYCARTGCKPWCFWFSEDGVAEAYLRWRKCNDVEREAAAAGLASGLLI